MMLSPESTSTPLIRISETDSTSSYLKTLNGKESLEEFTTVVADFQTAGRGQRGNSWESEAGKNLLFSFVLYPTFLKARHQFLLSQIISLAIKEVLDVYTDNVSIKWPNDLYWKQRKIGGTLIENDLTGCYLSQCIAGVGINLNQEHFYSNAPNPVSLFQITGQQADIDRVLNNIIRRTGNYYEQLKQGESAFIAKRYAAALYRKEGFHPYRDQQGAFEAVIAGVEPEGGLLLKDREGCIRKYLFKEIEYI